MKVTVSYSILVAINIFAKSYIISLQTNNSFPTFSPVSKDSPLNTKLKLSKMISPETRCLTCNNTIENLEINLESGTKADTNVRPRHSSFVKCCLVLAYVIIFILLFIIAQLVFNPFFKDQHCPTDSISFTKLKQNCYNISEDQVCSYRINPSTNYCYRIGDRGPCGENMAFYIQDYESHFGRCSCNYINNHRALIPDERGKNCYFVFSQGYCKEGQWLNLVYLNESSERQIAVCEDNFCKSEESSVPFIIEDQNPNKTCVKYEQTSEFCPDIQNYYIKFTPEFVYPHCVHKDDLNSKKLKAAGSPYSMYFEKPPDQIIRSPYRKTRHRKAGKIVG